MLVGQICPVDGLRNIMVLVAPSQNQRLSSISSAMRTSENTYGFPSLSYVADTEAFKLAEDADTSDEL
jgi:hypothetical protein